MTDQQQADRDLGRAAAGIVHKVGGKQPKRYRCKRCGRDTFAKPGPHRCMNSLLVHYGRQKWKDLYDGNMFEEVTDD